MSFGYWSVVALDDECERWACQRSPIFGNEEFETVGPFSSEEDAWQECDLLNESVADEIESIPCYGQPEKQAKNEHSDAC